MSRCYPYPPPGYTLGSANNDALIESIKLENEIEKTREHNKERKSEKKDKKKEKRKDEKNVQNKADVPKSQTLMKFPDVKGETIIKGKEIVTEQLERSDLTQEHGLPVCMKVLPTSSAESTDTSNKRKRLSSPSNDSRIHGTGNVLRIKLASKKQKTGSITSVSELRVLSKPEITNLVVESKDAKLNGGEDFRVATTTNVEQICSTSRPLESLTNGKSSVTPLPNAVMTSMGRKEKKYNDIIMNWAPPQLVQHTVDEDLDWLFQKHEVSAKKSLRTQTNGVSCVSSSLMQPRAQLLDDVNIYALPFTVPF